MAVQSENHNKELTSTISSKGQITIPVAVRRHLGVDANDKVAFTIDYSGQVKIKQAEYPTIASLRGAAGMLKKPMSWKEVRQIAREDRLKK